MKKNVMLGIAAGVAAVVVVGIIAKRKGLLDSLLNKFSDFAEEVEDKFNSMDKFGIDDVIPKGEDKNVSQPLSSN